MMSPRSLLFSSDEETSRRMAQAFEELGLQVESCPDIFSALERVTGQSFEVILADLDLGPEAAFLLKTAHELKLNQGAFAFAVATGMAYAKPQEFGVELVLAKPIIPDQVKYALLSCDGFLAGMRSWSVPADSAAKKETTAAVPVTQSRPVRPQGQSVPGKLPIRPAEPSPTLNQGLVKRQAPSNVAPANSKPGPASPSPTTLSPNRSATVQRKGGVGQNKVLWSTTLGVAALAFAYGVMPLPNLRVLASTTAGYRKTLGEVYTQTLEVAQDSSNGPEETGPAMDVEAGPAAAFPASRVPSHLSAQRMSPARRSPIPGQRPPAGPEAVQAGANQQPALVAVDTRRVQIPDSIRLAQPQDSVRTVAAKVPPLLGQLEPITLSEDAAEQLLAQKVQPSYPQQALKAGLQGAVVLQAWIGSDGNIRELKLVRGSLLLGQAAYKAVKQWRYKPYLLDGKAVEAQTYVTVNFRLPQQSLLLPAGR